MGGRGANPQIGIDRKDCVGLQQCFREEEDKLCLGSFCPSPGPGPGLGRFPGEERGFAAGW